MKIRRVASVRAICIVVVALTSARFGLAQITLDGANHCTSAGSNVATVSCSLPSVTAGDLITVEFADRNGTVTSVSDAHNGTYTQIFYAPNTGDPSYGGMAYFANSASGAQTVSVTLSSGSSNWAILSVEAWKGVAPSGALDTTAVTQHQVSTSGTVANGSCGTAQTPSGTGELIVGYIVTDNVSSASAGSNYTLIDTNTTTNPAFAEYWIQTTAQATNAPFVNAADDWIAGCAAFKPASSGGGSITGGGSANTIPVFTGASTLGNSVITQSGGNVGIGTTTPNAPLQINSTKGLIVGNPTYNFPNGSADEAVFAGNIALQNMSLANWVGIEFKGGNLYSSPSMSLGYSPSAGSNGQLQFLNGSGVPVMAIDPNGYLHMPDGTVQMTAWTGVLCGGDYAEAVNASGSRKSYQPGDVLTLTTGAGDDVQKSAEAYSTMVAGIYATKPGVIGRRESLPKDGQEIPMAMVGIVPTKVTTENGPIKKGDLLVTSSTPGYAMKGTDRAKMLGAVIGKAMGSLEERTGVIEVLVTLQ